MLLLSEQILNRDVGSISTAVWKRGGPELRKKARIASNSAPKIERFGYEDFVEVGTTVLCEAENLDARYIIQVAVRGYDENMCPFMDKDIVRLATRNSLEQAKKLGLDSIAIHPLGTGAGGISLGASTECMIDEFRKALIGPETSLKEIKLVLYGSDAYRSVKLIVDKILKK